MHSSRLLLVASMCALWGCTTDVDLEDAGFDAGPTNTGHRDAGIDAGSNAPLKLVFVFDAAQSLRVTDPNGERVSAMIDLLDQLPLQTDSSLAVMAFAGTTTGWLNANNREFTPLTSLSAVTKSTIATRALTFTSPQSPDAGGDTVDWVRALSDAWTLVYLDAMSAVTNGDPKARYVVFFITDGHPTNNQDVELLCGDVVRRIRNLRLYADDVTVNTVHIFKPTQPLPPCVPDAGAIFGGTFCGIPTIATPGLCPAVEVELDAERLNAMATLGGGAFRDFRAGQPVNYVGLIP